MGNVKPVFNRTAHATLWLAIADRLRVTGQPGLCIGDLKQEMIENLGLPGMPLNECYACDYNYSLEFSYQGSPGCRFCPLKNWSCSRKYSDIDSLYRLDEEDFGESARDYCYKTAIEIALWPVEPGILCV